MVQELDAITAAAGAVEGDGLVDIHHKNTNIKNSDSSNLISQKRSHEDMQIFWQEQPNLLLPEDDHHHHQQQHQQQQHQHFDDYNLEYSSIMANYLSESHDIHDHQLDMNNSSNNNNKSHYANNSHDSHEGSHHHDEPQLVSTNHLGIPHQVLMQEPQAADTTTTAATTTTTDTTTTTTKNNNNNNKHVQPHPDCADWVHQGILVSPLEASSKKRSPFWQAFHQFQAKHDTNIEQQRLHHACCNLCGKTVNMGRDNSTTTLSQHLRKCNLNLWKQLKSSIAMKAEQPVVVVQDTTHDFNDHDEEEVSEDYHHQHNISLGSQLLSSTNLKRKRSNNTTSSAATATTSTISKRVSQQALHHYVQVAFLVRYQHPPPEEWPGLIRILHQELHQRMSKQGIFDIFEMYHPHGGPTTTAANHNSTTGSNGYSHDNGNSEAGTLMSSSRSHNNNHDNKEPKRYSDQAHPQYPAAPSLLQPHHHQPQNNTNHMLLLSPAGAIPEHPLDDDEATFMSYTNMEENMSHDLHLHMFLEDDNTNNTTANDIHNAAPALAAFPPL